MGGNRLGYTPESHINKPRNINSNEARQRTMDGSGISSQFNYSGGIHGDGNEALEYDINLTL